MYKPMDERKSLTKGQFRVMRIIALIIFTLLVIISYTSSGKTVPRKGQYLRILDRATKYTVRFPAEAFRTLSQLRLGHEYC